MNSEYKYETYDERSERRKREAIEREAIRKYKESRSRDSLDAKNAQMIREKTAQREKDKKYILDFRDKVMSGLNVKNAVNQATNAINLGYGLADAARERRLASMGVKRSAEQIAADNLKSSLNQTAGLVSAENRARRLAKDRDIGLKAGLKPAPSGV